MTQPWYVWLVFRYAADEEPAKIAVIGVFSARERALAAAYSGCGVVTLALDDPIQGLIRLNPEWID